MARKKLIGYDLDGTLADTRQDIVLGVQFMLKEMNKPVLSAQEIERCVGEGLHHLVAMASGENDPRILEKGARLLRKYYEKHLLEHTCLYPQAQKLLNRFSDRIQIVITNKPEPFTSQILEGLGIMPYLKGVFTGEKGRLSGSGYSKDKATLPLTVCDPRLLATHSPVRLNYGTVGLF